MNKKLLVAIGLLILLGVGVFVGKSILRDRSSKPGTSSEADKTDSYYTCPMHPQVHQDHPGECPICHMKLVKVVKKPQAGEAGAGAKRSAVDVTASQLAMIGVQKQEVEKMTLKAVIPVSGRILSSSNVAFQVYEKDLRYVHAGLPFRGGDNIYSEEEISGTLTSVDSIVDPTSRTVRVVGAIRKGPKGLLSETSFSGVIELELKDRVAIPESSVLHTGKGDLVYLLESENRLVPKEVKLGIKTEGFYEVLSGLEPGQTISSGPNFLIDSEAKIRGAND